VKLSRIAPELRGAVRRTLPMPLERAWFRRLVRVLINRARARRVPGVVLELPEGTGLRVHRPREVRSDAALLWIHGGGLVVGGPVQDDAFCAATARELGVTVVSAAYRLAPDHPYPAPLDDCHTAWTWLLEHATSLGVDPARIAVGGQSAGGGLAAALAQRLHDDGGPQPVAQWLFCPMLDDRTAARRELDGVRHRVWNNRLNRFGWRSYLAAEPGAATPPPYAVPARREDLGGLPPAWIGVGDVDLFHDEDHEYARRLLAAGVATTFRAVPGAPHGFEVWAAGSGLARDHVAAARRWLRQVLVGEPDRS
jgi:acetyl esterase/lipase